MKRIVLCLLVAGCTSVGPDYKRPDIELPAQYPVAASPESPPTETKWWALYRDPLLDELVASVHERNADLRLATAQVEEAEAVMRQARAALFPEITGSFTRTRARVGTLTAPPPVAGAPLERNDARLVASTSFELDFWGRMRSASDATRASLLGSQLAKEVVTLTLSGLAAQTYFGLRSLDAQIVVLDNSWKLRKESLDIARARANAGLASELDVHQAQGALSDALAQRRDAARASHVEGHRIAEALDAQVGRELFGRRVEHRRNQPIDVGRAETRVRNRELRGLEHQLDRGPLAPAHVVGLSHADDRCSIREAQVDPPARPAPIKRR